MVLAVVDLHRLRVDMRLERAEVVRKVWKRECHFVLLSRSTGDVARLSNGSRCFRDRCGRSGSLRRASLRAAYDSRHYRDQNHDNHHYLDVLVYPRNEPAEKETCEHHAPDPGHRA